MVKLYPLLWIVPSVYAARFRRKFLLNEATQDGVFAELNAETLSADVQHVSCVVTEWGPWEECDILTGKRTRSRTVTTQPQGKGKACPDLDQTVPCEHIDCSVSKWSPWSACDKDGYTTRKRDIVRHPLPNGRPCPHQDERKKCLDVDCRVCEWSEWSTCDQETGLQKHTREIVRQPEFGGKGCPDLVEYKNCTVDCVLKTEYGLWSACDDDGNTYHVKGIKYQARNGGLPCPSEEERTEHDTCKVDCVLDSCDNVKEWGQCNELGNKVATQPIKVTAKNGGNECPDQTCSSTCPVDCVLDTCDNAQWTECDVEGKKTAIRDILSQALNEGTCPSEEERTCHGKCEKVNCEMEWGKWSECNYGLQTRSREIKTPPKYGGTPCEDDTEEQRTCSDADCVVSDWLDWGQCDNNGYRHRHRTIIKDCDADEGGRKCPDLNESEDCSVKCQVSEWSYTKCDKDGYRTKSRTIIKYPTFRGDSCPSDLSVREKCPIDCQTSNWSNWSCNESTGKKTRSKTIKTQAQYGGQPCPSPSELIEVGDDCDPVDCKVSRWGPFVCVNHRQKRYRSVISEAKWGGKCDYDLEQTRAEQFTCP